MTVAQPAPSPAGWENLDFRLSGYVLPTDFATEPLFDSDIRAMAKPPNKIRREKTHSGLFLRK
jgi:hypothetical protein